MDRNMFEVYKGLNKEHPTPRGRFANLPLLEYRKEETRYYPIELILEFEFARLPTNELFIDICEKLTEQSTDEDNLSEKPWIH